MIVAADGSGDVRTVQEAIDRVPANNAGRVVIRIKNGVYKEKLSIDKPHITLIGEDAERTIVTYDDFARKKLPNGEAYGTFRSYTAFVGGDDFAAERITFENAAGPGEIVGQALAAYVDADRARFRECRFLGHQDTLFTGPLPPAPMKPGTAFACPRGDAAPRSPIRQYYRDCYIEGDVDFIFGSATAVFDRCTIHSKNRLDRDLRLEPPHHAGINGWCTAASTPEGAPFGYVFLDCRLTSDAPPATVLLGRPWRGYAKTAFLRCWMGEHIRPDGWDNWDKPEAEGTAVYCEYGNVGPGAALDRRVPWAKRLTPEEAAAYEVSNVLPGWDEII